jgi:hypothetical protein
VTVQGEESSEGIVELPIISRLCYLLGIILHSALDKFDCYVDHKMFHRNKLVEVNQLDEDADLNDCS